MAKRGPRSPSILHTFSDALRSLQQRHALSSAAVQRLVFDRFVRPDDIDAPAEIAELFARYRWSLSDAADAITPDVLGVVLERVINQKLHGAYYTPVEITTHLCERTIHRAVLEAVNAATPVRFANVTELFARLDDSIAASLLDDILPRLSVLDPACGAGAFLVGAMRTLVGVYRAVADGIERHGGAVSRDRLTTIRAEGESFDAAIIARVLRDNLHGVDLMPDAVETTRLRLQLEALAIGGALASAEPNVVAGNALIGLLESHGENASTQHELDAQLLDRFRDLGIRYERSTWNADMKKHGPPKRRPIELDDVVKMRPLHWPLAFGDVMRRRGFDVVLANPPWDVFKPNGKEFFAAHSDRVTKKSMSIHDFEAEQARLLLDPAIRDAWLDYRSEFPHQSAYFRAAPEYAHQTSRAAGRRVGTDLNLYKLFVKRCHRLLRPGGHCGVIVPSGIYTDLGAKGLREMLFDQSTIESLFCIENRDGVFGDVHRMFKFVILEFARGGTTREFPAAFMRREVSELKQFPDCGGVTIDVDLIRKLSPDSLSVMEFKSGLDVTIARKMARFPLLGEDVPGAWKLRLSREFDMTNDGGLFKTTPGAGRLPLFEGKMIGQFDVDFAAARYWVEEREGRANLSSGTGISACGLESQAGMPVPLFAYERSRLGIRAVASNVNSRTLIGAIVPAGSFCGNSLLVDAGGLSESESLYLLGVMNSFALDWLVRQKVTTNVNMFQVYQLPVPRLRAGDEAFDAIVGRVARLGDAGASERSALRTEIDSRVARLYGLDTTELRHVLDAFPLIDREERDYVMQRSLGDEATTGRCSVLATTQATRRGQ